MSDADWFDEVCGHHVLRTVPKGYRHGEYDALRTMSRRTVRRLIGAGWLSPRGVAPDVLAHVVEANGGPRMTTDECVTWYCRLALRVLAEDRRRRHRRRHERVARQGGHESYYRRRVALAQAAGHPSLWHYRKAKGWT